MTGSVVLAFGGNIEGVWGPPSRSIGKALQFLGAMGVRVCAASSLYRSPPAGGMRQPEYTNLVALVETSLPPEALLSVAKRIEKAAGRRSGRRWGARPLDIDIIDYKNRLMGGRAKAGPYCRRRLCLPHPCATERSFVLRPLAEISPFWHHPVSGKTSVMLAQNPALPEDAVRIKNSAFGVEFLHRNL